MEDSIKLMLIEDHEVVRRGIKSLLEQNTDMKVVAESDNGTYGIDLALKSKPDIVITDIKLPDISGFEVLEKLINLDFTSKFVILTSYNSENDINKAISLGIYAYILKDISPDVLVSVIKSVYSGAIWLDPKVVPFVRNINSETFVKNSQSNIEFKNSHSNLTKREYEVLKLIVNGKSNSDIANILSISEHTAKAHVCNIIQKLVVDDRTQAAVKAIKEGIV